MSIVERTKNDFENVDWLPRYSCLKICRFQQHLEGKIIIFLTLFSDLEPNLDLRPIPYLSFLDLALL